MKEYKVTLVNKFNWNFSFEVIVKAKNDFDAVDIAYCELFEQYEKTEEEYELKQLERLK